MAQEIPAEEPMTSTTATHPLPWYSLHPRALRQSRMLRAVLIALLLFSFSVAPLWRAAWYVPIYAYRDFLPTRDDVGHFEAAWHWIDGHEIRIYAMPGIRQRDIEETARGVQAMVDDIGLNFRVRAMPLPPAIAAAYQQSLETRRINGQPSTCVRFSRLASHLISRRGGDPHADVLLVNEPLAEATFAFGMGDFTPGLSVIRGDCTSYHVAKHETGHLLGYLYHDNYPLFVFGYAGELAIPTAKQTLMMMTGDDNTLSPRARDALHSFWRGMEARSHRRYFR